MTKSILSIATALLAAATLFTSAAQACISCEYVPEVTKTPHPSEVYAKKLERKRVNIAAKQRVERPSKKRAPKIETARVEQPVAKKVEAKAAETPVPAPAETANSTPVETTPATDEKPIETASLPEGTDITGEMTCKKFIPTAEVTISVPCE